MRNKTTIEHYHKYQRIKKNLGVSFKGSILFGSKESLVKMFIKDNNLNQIPLHNFDSMFFIYNKKGGCKSLAECTCFIKHCLIYDIIGAEPEFIDYED